MSNLEGQDFFDDCKRRADVIDAVVKALEVSYVNKHGNDSNPMFDKYQVRASVAIALSLYIEPNDELLNMMLTLTPDSQIQNKE
jgi:hypothetical protein